MPVLFEEHWYNLQDESTIPIIFKDNKYTLYAVDGLEYYYVDNGKHLHRYFLETEKWEMNLLNSSSLLMNVHVTVNNYIFVGINSCKLYRSIDGRNNFTISYEWQQGGSYRPWGIASDKDWIINGEYGIKIIPPSLCAR